MCRVVVTLHRSSTPIHDVPRSARSLQVALFTCFTRLETDHVLTDEVGKIDVKLVKLVKGLLSCNPPPVMPSRQEGQLHPNKLTKSESYKRTYSFALKVKRCPCCSGPSPV